VVYGDVLPTVYGGIHQNVALPKSKQNRTSSHGPYAIFGHFGLSFQYFFGFKFDL